MRRAYGALTPIVITTKQDIRPPNAGTTPIQRADCGPTLYQHRYSHDALHDALNQSWVNVGPPSVTLVHIQRGFKHDTVTQ